jgi:hypothetical protein
MLGPCLCSCLHPHHSMYGRSEVLDFLKDDQAWDYGNSKSVASRRFAISVNGAMKLQLQGCHDDFRRRLLKERGENPTQERGHVRLVVAELFLLVFHATSSLGPPWPLLDDVPFSEPRHPLLLVQRAKIGHVPGAYPDRAGGPCGRPPTRTRRIGTPLVVVLQR